MASHSLKYGNKFLSTGHQIIFQPDALCSSYTEVHLAPQKGPMGYFSPDIHKYLSFYLEYILLLPIPPPNFFK